MIPLPLVKYFIVVLLYRSYINVSENAKVPSIRLTNDLLSSKIFIGDGYFTINLAMHVDCRRYQLLNFDANRRAENRLFYLVSDYHSAKKIR